MKKILTMLLFLAISFAFAKVDINSADAETLASIKGLGVKKAEAIVEYREKNGNFTSVEEIVKVKGIGKKLLETIKNDIEVQ